MSLTRLRQVYQRKISDQLALAKCIIEMEIETKLYFIQDFLGSRAVASLPQKSFFKVKQKKSSSILSQFYEVYT